MNTKEESALDTILTALINDGHSENEAMHIMAKFLEEEAENYVNSIEAIEQRLKELSMS